MGQTVQNCAKMCQAVPNCAKLRKMFELSLLWHALHSYAQFRTQIFSIWVAICFYE